VLNAFLIAQTIAIGILAMLVVGLLRAHATVLKLLHDNGMSLEEGGSAPSHQTTIRPTSTPAFDVAGPRLSGGAVSMSVVGADNSTLLVFLSSGCASCQVIWAELGDPELRIPGRDTRLVAITKDPQSESESRLKMLAPDDVVVVQSTEVWEQYQVPVTPYFILVDGPSGTVQGEGTASSWSQMLSLMGQAIADTSIKKARKDPDTGELAADVELKKSGIGQGHASLYPGANPPVQE